MPEQAATPSQKPKQRLSTPQMLHLMRLEMDRALRHDYPISCMVLGLDGFDQPDERYFRKEIMPAAFHQLKEVTFANDVRGLGIWTEGYLLAIFPHVTPERIGALAEEMLRRADDVENPQASEEPLTFCVGVSHNLRPGDSSFELLVEEAELGMGLAKKAGGNRVVQALDAETEVDRLREELDHQIEELRTQQDSYFGDREDQEESWGKELLEKVLRLFEREPEQSEGVLRLKKEVIALLTAELHAWRELSSVSQLLESQRQIGMLERRVTKLNESLGMTEEELKRVAAAKNIDLGISSIYRTVQGLSSDSDNAEQKREMLKELFDANVALQAAITGSES